MIRCRPTLALAPRRFPIEAPSIGWCCGHGMVAACRMPTTRLVRIANGILVVFGVAAVVAVPQPQAIVLVAALAVQAVASRVTLPGPGERA